ISNFDHWMLDSTLGFLALSPVVFIGVALLARFVPPRSPKFPLIAGVLFAALTIPGPIAHDKVVGEDTVGATVATHFCGIDQAALAKQGVEHSAISECFVQFVVGIPTYVTLFFIAWLIGKAVKARRYPTYWTPTSDFFLVVTPPNPN